METALRKPSYDCEETILRCVICYLEVTVHKFGGFLSLSAAEHCAAFLITCNFACFHCKSIF